jgi:hypothetical protein
VNETEHFVNDGFGWECRRCRGPGGDAAERADGESPSAALPRFFREGEAEGGGPRLASRSRARWTDESRRALRCPACGAEERIEG